MKLMLGLARSDRLSISKLTALKLLHLGQEGHSIRSSRSTYGFTDAALSQTRT